MSPYEYKKIADEVDAYVAAIVEEYNESIVTLRNNPKVVRIRMLIAFSFLEVLCNIYNSYFDLKLGNRELMRLWLREYCLNEKNRVYSVHPYLNLVDDEYMYSFRCSIVHALALPEPKSESKISICIPNGDETTEVIRKMDEGFKKVGHTVAFISADQMMKMIIEGYYLMHPLLYKVPTMATKTDFDSMKRVVDEFARRGAKPVPLLP